MSRSMRLYFVPVLALLTVPAWGDVLYSNGAINGTNSGWAIYAGDAVSDSFVISSDSTVTDLSNIGIWLDSGDTLTSLNWTISTAPDDGGTIEGSSAGATPESAAQLTPAGNYGFSGTYDVYNVSFSVPSLFLAAGTYYLTLENATAASVSGQIYWDENDGPSTAGLYSGGSLSQTIGSQAFEIDGSPVPEPASLLLLGAGLVGLGAMKKFGGRG